ncbi:paramyosin, long form-like isoform X2 [Homarus americanus]|uniref:paramyosin, long form-like isoform X2 n=1 Tax=Homarus americanus TaxID=6706 RepID=UPI001C47E45C|nr:paramyosin, long form-like isoform X2 [Homarus americanus]
MPAHSTGHSTVSVTKTSYKSGNKSPEFTSSSLTSYAQSSALEDKIRLLMEDIEYERELRQRVEREKADLSVQVIQLSERIEEVEAGADGQVEINKKRDAELAKLRKLLEDVHLESEQTHHMLKKKHQEAVVDFQDQIDILTKSKYKVDKEKAKFQQESYELTEQLEKVTLESASYHKSIKSLNITIQEMNIRIEELNRTIVDITSSKQRLSVENVELTKSVQELKVKIEEVNYSLKSSGNSLEEYRRRFDVEEARRRKLESEIHSLNNELNALKRSYEEECELRIDIERKLSSESALTLQYKSKYEMECRIHLEEVEEIKKKMHVRIVELEEHCSSLSQKVSALEKQKSRLSQEIEIMILDLEKANANHRECKTRLETVDREYKTLLVKYEELNMLYEQTSKDLKVRVAEYNKVTNELEHVKDVFEKISIDYKKISTENGDLKASVGDLGRIKHDLELEIRRLEAERNELANALHESDSARKEEEHRFIKISNEYQSYRVEIEKRLHIREEELESVRKQMAIEVDNLNARVVEAETRLKSEVTKIKKKMQVTITELEMTLDTANKSNIDLQKTVKRQGISLQELQAHYDELQRQLQQTLDQYGVAQRRLQSLTAEYEEARANLDGAIRGRRSVEMQYEEASARLKDLTTINVNISNAKAKLEQELCVIAGDYDEVSKEFRLSEERLSKTTIELKRTIELLHEESERYVKIESIKKSLEVEVKNLTIRIENVEANSLASTKRMVSKLEGRVHDLELALDEEQRRHVETIKCLRKKERNVKELVLQCEEDHKNIQILQETLDKTYEKINVYKRQLNEQESVSSTNLTRVRRFQRELEAAEERAETAESSLSMIRAKHRTFVTCQTTQLPSGETVIVKETVSQQ